LNLYYYNRKPNEDGIYDMKPCPGFKNAIMKKIEE